PDRLEPATFTEQRQDLARLRARRIVVGRRRQRRDALGAERGNAARPVHVPLLEERAHRGSGRHALRLHGAHANCGSRFALNASYDSRKFGSVMQPACTVTSHASAVSRSIDHSRSSDSFEIASPNDGPRASFSANILASSSTFLLGTTRLYRPMRCASAASM